MTYIVCDTETTGTQAGSRILEIGAVELAEDGRIIRRFDQLINPGMPLPTDACAVHGITPDLVADAPSTRTALRTFLDWLPTEWIFVAHNAPFDVSMLQWECERLGVTAPSVPVVDTLVLARRLPGMNGHRLTDLMNHYEVPWPGDAHRALADAEALASLLPHLLSATTPTQTPWRTNYHYPTTIPTGWETFETSVVNGASIRFSYHHASGHTSQRTVTPYGWAQRTNGITIHGWCHDQQARRTFRVDRTELCS